MEINKFMSRRKFMQTLLMASSASAVDWAGLGALADNIPQKNDYPVVVIGAGLGGLVSAAYLSKFGFKVTVLEQHRIPGGYATSFQRKKGKYCFDVSLHATVAQHGIPQKILSDLGLWDKIKVVWTPELRRIVAPDFDVTLPAKNPTGVIAELSKTFPHEAKGIQAFYSEMEAVIAGLWQRKQSAVAVMKKLEKISLHQWMTMHVSTPGVIQCMAIFSKYYGLEPSKINALFYAIATGEYLVHGGQYYKTRSQDLSNTLAQAIEDNGGKIYFRTKVDKILFDDGRKIRAVKDTLSNRYPAKAVIANCSVPALLDTMLPPSMVPAAYKADVRQHNNSHSSFVVWLGLNTSITDHVKEYETSILQDSQSFGKPNLSRKDLGESNISVTIYDNLLRGYSQPGTTTMAITCLSDFEPWKKFESDYFKGVKGDYRQKKERIAAQLIKRVERKLIPGLSDSIEVLEIGTPLTNKRYTGNPDGAIYGFDRDMPHLKTKTPVNGLYLSSAWSHGGGYTPVMNAGRQAAETLLEVYQG